MNKKVAIGTKTKIKKDQATFSRLVGCYVDCKSHEKARYLGGKFQTLEEDEYYKYLRFQTRCFSGTLETTCSICLERRDAGFYGIGRSKRLVFDNTDGRLRYDSGAQ